MTSPLQKSPMATQSEQVTQLNSMSSGRLVETPSRSSQRWRRLSERVLESVICAFASMEFLAISLKSPKLTRRAFEEIMNGVKRSLTPNASQHPSYGTLKRKFLALKNE